MPLARNENGDIRREPGGRQLFQCDNCGVVEPWNDNWAWFGSYRQLEDYGCKGVEPVLAICSNVCRIKMVATGRLPHEGLNDDGSVIEDYAPPIKPRRSKQTQQTSAMEAP